MKTTKLFLLLFISILTISLSSCKKDDDDGGNFAKITVTGSVEGTPTEGIVVNLIETTNGAYNFILKKNTDSNGKAIFDNLIAGQYYFECDYYNADGSHYGGYATPDINVADDENKLISINITHE